jgi:hypothetical protein
MGCLFLHAREVTAAAAELVQAGLLALVPGQDRHDLAQGAVYRARGRHLDGDDGVAEPTTAAGYVLDRQVGLLN